MSESASQETSHLSTGTFRTTFLVRKMICIDFGQSHRFTPLRIENFLWAGMMVFSMILWMSFGHKLAHR